MYILIKIKTSNEILESDYVNFVCTHTKILFIITFTIEFVFYLVV